jgi:hypothetical protein
MARFQGRSQKRADFSKVVCQVKQKILLLVVWIARQRLETKSELRAVATSQTHNLQKISQIQARPHSPRFLRLVATARSSDFVCGSLNCVRCQMGQVCCCPKPRQNRKEIEALATNCGDLSDFVGDFGDVVGKHTLAVRQNPHAVQERVHVVGERAGAVQRYASVVG